MIGPFLRDLAAKFALTTASGMAYGLLNGCFVTFSEDPSARCISIYVGPQEQPAPGYAQSQTVSCANQICHAITTASGAENVYALRDSDAAHPALVLNHAGSVVTVFFRASVDAEEGVTRFVTELLPQIAPLTRPTHCILCCTATTGDAVPVRLSADTVVPMHAPCCRKVRGYAAPSPEERSTQRKAVWLAVAGALMAAVIWALMAPLGPLAWITGVLLGALPVLGYDLAKGKMGRERLVTLLCCAICAVLLGSLGAGFISAHRAWTQEIALMQANAIGYFAYAWASLVDPVSGRLSLILRTILAGAIAAAIGLLLSFRRKPDAASAAAEAVKPRRLRGKF